MISLVKGKVQIEVISVRVSIINEVWIFVTESANFHVNIYEQFMIASS